MGAARKLGRVLLAVVTVVLALAAVALGATYLLSGTDWGRERVRRVAQNRLNTIAHGKASIGKLTGSLLTGLTAHDVSITDSTGAPFVTVESFSGTYSLMAIARKQVWVDNIVVVRPRIVLDRPPNGKWNWDRIFPRGGPDTGVHTPGWLDRVRFTNVTVVDAHLIVRSPWHPSDHLSAAASDSMLRKALAGKTRLVVQKSGDGYQKIVTLDSVSAKIPLLRISEPGQPYRLAEVASMTMKAYPFQPPAIDVRDVKGIFPFTSDSVWWNGAYAALPNSKATGSGSYVIDSGDMTMAIHGEPVSFADMQWIDPRLPADATGSGDLRITWRGRDQDYAATNANVALAGARASGTIAVTMGDTITVHDTKLRFSGLATSQLERLIPKFKSPRTGTLSGVATVSGGQHALTLNTDLSFSDRQAGVSHITAVGQIGFTSHSGELRAHDLKVQLMPVQVAMARTWYPTLPIEGTVTGTATINGSTQSQLVVTANLDHRDRGTRSVADGTATIHLTGAKQIDVNITARPVSLEEVGRFFPAAGLQGTAVGPVKISGPLANLNVNADLRLPDGGRFTTTGTLDVASADNGYDLTSSLYTLNLRTIDSKAPVTSLTARAEVHGRGTDVATMHTTFAADVSTSNWRGAGNRPIDSVAVDTASLRGSVANGIVTVDKLYAVGAHATATASGSFGLTHEQTGTLTYSVSTDSLGAFNRLIPRTQTVAAGPVAPRPQNVSRAVQRARADSARIDRATEMERLINGKPGPRLVVNGPQPVPSDTLLGTVAASGTLKGNIYDFDLLGKANGQNIVARGNSAHRLVADYSWTHARTPQSALAATVSADTASLMGFEFDSLTATATYTDSGGHAEVSVNQSDNRHYAAKGDYALFQDRKELHLADLALQFDTASWTMTRPSVISWGDPGVHVADFELHNRGNGRIYANGLLPTEGTADFALQVDNFPLSNVIDLLQTDLDFGGNVTLEASVAGTPSAPEVHGTFDLAQATYNKTTVPSLRGKIDYEDRLLSTHIDAVRNNGLSMATIDGKLPVNLALTGVTGDRLLPDPLSIDLEADSLPLELLPSITDAVTDLHGVAAGNVKMRGTLKKPALDGTLSLKNGSAVIAATGAKLVEGTASVRMMNDTVYVDSIAARTKIGRATDGSVNVHGTLAVGDWREPAMNLAFTARGAQLLDNPTGNVRVDADLKLEGPFREASLTGATTIVRGVVYAPEPNVHHFLVGAGDPSLYNVLDTLTNERDLFPPTSPLLANLKIEMSLTVKRDTWVRNREANVEVYTDDPLILRQEQSSLSLTGVLATDRGEYDFLSKRFQIKRGSALFIGTPDLDPTLQISGEFQVSAAAGRAVNIRVLVGGTLRRPKVSLESDAQPPKTQSELLSLLAFGGSTTSLSTTNSSSIAGSAATNDLFGIGAQVAVQRLAGVAVGVAVQQVEIQAGRAFGTDVFTITPGDVPLFGGSGLGNFFTQTRIEAGKYVNGRTFLSAQEQAGRPGLAIEHRTADGWHFTASMEPRILLGEPTLSLQPHRTTQAYGGFVLREWRF